MHELEAAKKAIHSTSGILNYQPSHSVLQEKKMMGRVREVNVLTVRVFVRNLVRRDSQKSEEFIVFVRNVHVQLRRNLEIHIFMTGTSGSLLLAYKAAPTSSLARFRFLLDRKSNNRSAYSSSVLLLLKSFLNGPRSKLFSCSSFRCVNSSTVLFPKIGIISSAGSKRMASCVFFESAAKGSITSESDVRSHLDQCTKKRTVLVAARNFKFLNL